MQCVKSIVRQQADAVCEFLALRSYVATTSTLAKLAYDGDEKRAMARLTVLANNGQLTAQKIFSPPPPDIVEPLRYWEPGDPVPTEEEWKAECKQLSNKSRNRWKAYPEWITVWRASRRTGNRFGGMGTDRGLTRREMETIRHDIAFAESLSFFRDRPEFKQVYAEQIYKADLPHTRGEKVADGLVLVAEDNTVALAIESLGVGYPPARIDAKHRFFAYKRWPYLFV